MPINYIPREYFGWILELYVIDILGQLNTDHVNILDESYNSMWLIFDANWLPNMWIFWMNFRILSNWYFWGQWNTYHVNILDES
jgi:hypothetical protein